MRLFKCNNLSLSLITAANRGSKKNTSILLSFISMTKLDLVRNFNTLRPHHTIQVVPATLCAETFLLFYLFSFLRQIKLASRTALKQHHFYLKKYFSYHFIFLKKPWVQNVAGSTCTEWSVFHTLLIILDPLETAVVLIFDIGEMTYNLKIFASHVQL